MSILVATDFSENADKAVQMGARRARLTGVPLTVLHCLDADSSADQLKNMFNDSTDKVSRLRREAVEKLERSFQSLVPEDSRPTETEYIVSVESPEETIKELAPDFDLVVVGSRGGGPVETMLLGSTSERVVRSVDTPVWVVPHFVETDQMDRILAPVDFSDCSKASLECAVKWARDFEASLSVLHTYTLPMSGTSLFDNPFSPDQIQSIEQERQRQLQKFVGQFDTDGVELDLRVSVGYPYHVIFNTIEDEPIDLIVMGTHGREGVDRLFLGSNAVKILRKTPTSVLTIREHDDDR